MDYDVQYVLLLSKFDRCILTIYDKYNKFLYRYDRTSSN